MTNTYKIRISDRNATVYDVVDAYSLKSVAMQGLNPIQSKLMNQDIFRCDLGSFEPLHSSAFYGSDTRCIGFGGKQNIWQEE